MKFGTRTVVAFTLLLGSGCQSAPSPAPEAMAPAPQRAVVITAGNGGSTTVYLPSSDPASPLMMSTSPGMEQCPECKAAAIKYFQTGVLDPKCSRTGATRSVLVVPTTPYIGHN